MRRSMAICLVCSLMFLAWAVVAESAPYREPKTGLLFPDKVGGADRADVKNYEPEHPGLGIGVMYRAQTFKADVFVYDLKREAIPSDPASPAVTGVFDQAISDIYTLQSRGNYSNVAVQTAKKRW